MKASFSESLAISFRAWIWVETTCDLKGMIKDDLYC